MTRTDPNVVKQCKVVSLIVGERWAGHFAITLADDSMVALIKTTQNGSGGWSVDKPRLVAIRDAIDAVIHVLEDREAGDA